MNQFQGKNYWLANNSFLRHPEFPFHSSNHHTMTLILLHQRNEMYESERDGESENKGKWYFMSGSFFMKCIQVNLPDFPGRIFPV